MLYAFVAIFILSFVLAFRSMKDFNIPLEIKRLLQTSRIKGTIIFFKNKTVHYKKK